MFWKAGAFSVLGIGVADNIQRSIVHRGLVNNVKILHRDISSYNVLMYPKHNPEASVGKELVQNPPIFINEILRLSADNDSEESEPR